MFRAISTPQLWSRSLLKAGSFSLPTQSGLIAARWKAKKGPLKDYPWVLRARKRLERRGKGSITAAQRPKAAPRYFRVLDKMAEIQ